MFNQCEKYLLRPVEVRIRRLGPAESFQLPFQVEDAPRDKGCQRGEVLRGLAPFPSHAVVRSGRIVGLLPLKHETKDTQLLDARVESGPFHPKVRDRLGWGAAVLFREIDEDVKEARRGLKGSKNRGRHSHCTMRRVFELAFVQFRRPSARL